MQYEIYQTDWQTFPCKVQGAFCDFKYENGKSKFAPQHLLQNRHSTGPMEDIMEILQITRKKRMMNTFERHNEKMLDNQINDKCTVKPNAVFDAINQNNTSKEHLPL